MEVRVWKMKPHNLMPSTWISKAYKIGYSFHMTRRLDMRLLQKWVAFARGDRVCDIACGKGIMDLMIPQKFATCYGIDFDRENIHLAKLVNQNSSNEFMIGNSEYLPFKSHTFDKVICNCALEHFPNDTRALSEMSRVLKSQGLLFLTVDSFSYIGISDNLREMHRKKEAVVNYYDLDSLSMKLEGAGLYAVRKQYYIKSKGASFFIRIGIRLNFGVVFLLIFPIAYPITLLHDRLSSDEGGYRLAVLAQKRRS
jgi:ubiquinone/menaquinone biosynthesis C-methylase UbiE